MTITRTMNGNPITEEELSKILLWNPTIESICQGVLARVRKRTTATDDGSRQ